MKDNVFYLQFNYLLPEYVIRLLLGFQRTSPHSASVKLVQMPALIGVLPCGPHAEFSMELVSLKEQA